MELLQNKVIQRVKDKCVRDDRLDAALAYGSFTKGEGDQFSDCEARDLERAYKQTLQWGWELIHLLEQKHGFGIPADLMDAMANY